MAQFGHFSLVIAFLLALVCAALLGWAGHTRNASLERLGRQAVAVLAAIVTLAAFSLFYLLLSDDFSVKYVEATSRIDQPVIYKISAFWSAQEGSLLLWLWVLSLYMVAVAFFWAREAGRLLPYALSVLSVVAAFFSLVVAFIADPFEQQFPAPPDGRGMTPLLQDPGMMGHPLLLYVGYVGMAVPFAFGIATLLERQKGSEWLRITRRWTMVAWLFLTLGIVVGGWWAYHELGWGGYWAWDPVENASLMPWLVATAFFHSAMVEERRGLLKNWNILLIIFTFLLTVFGTFVTRSGILNSVHAFAQSPIGPWFMGFIGLVMAASLYLVFDRYDVVADTGSIESVFSKESSFLVNNLILASITLTVLLGTTFPLIIKLAGRDATIGAPYFNTVAGPLFAVMVVLMGICPLIAWRRASLAQFPRLFAWPAVAALAFGVALVAFGVRKPGAVAGFTAAAFVIFSMAREFWAAARARARIAGENPLVGLGKLMNRNPRRYGGYVVHLGIIVMVFGIVGSQFFQDTIKVPGLKVGESFRIAGYELTFQGLNSRYMDGGVEAVYAELDVKRDGRNVGTMRPERRFYPGYEQMGPSTEAAIRGGIAGDLYVVLGGWEANGAVASFQAWWNPLLGWIWIGLYIVVAGTIFAIWPRRRAAADARAAREQRVFAALGELEFDYQMGKVAAEDYEALRAEFAREAAAVLEAQERGKRGAKAPVPGSRGRG